MARALSWRQLVPGLVLSVVLLVTGFGVLRYARVGALRGDTIHLAALTDHASGLVVGSEVWVAGQKVGRVRAVSFAPPTTDSTLRIAIGLEVLASHREQIRRDSYAQIRPGGSLVGAPVLMVSLGTSATPALRDGDTISTRSEGDLEAVTSRAAIASRDFPAIIGNVKVLTGQLTSATSTIGAIITSDVGGDELSALARRTSRLAEQIGTGGGTVGRALHGDAVARARHASEQLDTLRALVAAVKPGSEMAGRFRRDTTLLSSVEDLRNEVSIVRALLAEPRGTAGRVLRDSALTREMTAAQLELDALVADIKARPFRYVTF